MLKSSGKIIMENLFFFRLVQAGRASLIACLWLMLLLCVATFLPPNICYAKKVAPEPAPQEVYPSLDRMLGAMLMFGFRGHDLAEDDPFYKLLLEGKVGSVVLFDKDVTTGALRNIRSPQQLKKLCDQLHKAHVLFIGVDQEGGQVRRLKAKNGFMDLPSAQAMGQGKTHETMAMADKLGQELSGLGINTDFAPVADVDTNPFNPVIGKLGRAFSSDAAIVSRQALAFGQGLAKNGVIPVLKHFPGQGCAEKDSHLGPTDVSQCWNPDIDLLPYAEILRAGWPGMVMTGHLLQRGLDPELPATLSRNVVTGLLREGLGWQGVVISDDMQMKAVTEGRGLKEAIADAINAGIDILLFGNNLEWDGQLPQKTLDALHELLAENRITEERVRQSWKRISTLAEAFHLLDPAGEIHPADTPSGPQQ